MQQRQANTKQEAKAAPRAAALPRRDVATHFAAVRLTAPQRRNFSYRTQQVRRGQTRRSTSADTAALCCAALASRSTSRYTVYPHRAALDRGGTAATPRAPPRHSRNRSAFIFHAECSAVGSLPTPWRKYTANTPPPWTGFDPRQERKHRFGGRKALVAHGSGGAVSSTLRRGK